MKKKVYYWSPFLSPIATCKAVINSAFSIEKFGNNHESYILNFFNEFSLFRNEIKKKNIKIINFYKFNFFRHLPYEGKIRSRISFIILFIFGIFPLFKKLKTNKPDYLIIHLISSLPLILLIFFKFETKFILRISGFPKLNFFRKILWKKALKNIHYVTCPTENTLNYIKQSNLVDESKLRLLYDPIITFKEVIEKKKELVNFENYYLSAGRLTKQKNFLFLCKAVKEIIKKDSNKKFLIAGNGEEKGKILKFIKNNKLEKNILLIGYVDNIFSYLNKAKGFILTSLWEDPGFVLIEAGICRTPVLSSDAWPGPIEIIKDKYNGYIYKSNDIKDFLKNFNIFEDRRDKNQIIFNHLKTIKKFTLLNHYKNIIKII